MKTTNVLHSIVAIATALLLPPGCVGDPSGDGEGTASATDQEGEVEGVGAASQALLAKCNMTSDLCGDDGLGGDHYTLWHCVNGLAPSSPKPCSYGCLTLQNANDKCGHPYVANATVMSVANNGHFDGSGRLFWADDAAHGAYGGNKLPAATAAVSTQLWVDNSTSGAGSAAGVKCLGGAAGDWCGSESNVLGGQTNVLYHCTPNSAATNPRVCTTTCSKHPGLNDTCAGVTEAITASAYQCAGFAEEASGASATASWAKGGRAIDNCPPAGTVVATFDGNGHYAGHTTIVVKCSSTALDVFDSNWIDTTANSNLLHVGRHTFTTAGATMLSNANNYYVVLGP